MTARTQALDMLHAVARKDADGRILHQFATDPGRVDRMGVDAAGLYLDLSKQAWSAEGFEAALDLARACDVEGRRKALFGGEAVNNTEGRAVLHPALRAADDADFRALGEPVSAEVAAARKAMDEHFLEADLECNAPVLLALAQIYNVEGRGRMARTVAPYAHGLRRLPAFLQQLEMESNGKRVKRDGSPVDTATSPIVFGEPGTNGQHAFFQQIHQGPMVVPAEFIVVGHTTDAAMDAREGDAPLWSNALAQAQALMVGKSEAEARAELIAAGADAAEADRLAPHKTFPGDRPSTTILMDALSPEAVGALIALYEHKTFVEGVIQDINSFDQWGVELGKALAKAVLADVAAGEPSAGLDPSTAELLKRLMV